MIFFFFLLSTVHLIGFSKVVIRADCLFDEGMFQIQGALCVVPKAKVNVIHPIFSLDRRWSR